MTSDYKCETESEMVMLLMTTSLRNPKFISKCKLRNETKRYIDREQENRNPLSKLEYTKYLKLHGYLS